MFLGILNNYAGHIYNFRTLKKIKNGEWKYFRGNEIFLGINTNVYGLFPHMDRHTRNLRTVAPTPNTRTIVVNLYKYWHWHQYNSINSSVTRHMDLYFLTKNLIFFSICPIFWDFFENVKSHVTDELNLYRRVWDDRDSRDSRTRTTPGVVIWPQARWQPPPLNGEFFKLLFFLLLRGGWVIPSWLAHQRQSNVWIAAARLYPITLNHGQ